MRFTDDPPLTGPECYCEAQRLLAEHTDRIPDRMANVAEAQVWATLAAAAATALAAIDTVGPAGVSMDTAVARRWREVVT